MFIVCVVVVVVVVVLPGTVTRYHPYLMDDCVVVDIVIGDEREREREKREERAQQHHTVGRVLLVLHDH